VSLQPTILADAVDAFADASLEAIQDILTGHYGVRPADQQIHDWLTEPTAEIVEGDLDAFHHRDCACARSSRDSSLGGDSRSEAAPPPAKAVQSQSAEMRASVERRSLGCDTS